MMGACWQARALGAGWSLQGQVLASVPAVSLLELDVKVADPPCLLGHKEGSGNGVPQTQGIGLQEDRGASHELQGPSSQRGGGMGALGGQQWAAGGGEAEHPLEGVVGGEEGTLWRRLVEEEGDKAQDCVGSLQKGERSQVNR